MEELENLPTQVIEVNEKTATEDKKKKASAPKRRPTDEMKARTDFENVETVMCVRYLLIGFRFLGVHMPKTHKALYIIWSIILNMAVTVYLPIAFTMLFVTMLGEEVEVGNIFECMQVFINVLACSSKLIIMGFLLPRLLSCEPILKKLDRRCSTEEELNSLKDLIKKGNRLVVLFGISYWGYSTTTCISAVIFHRLPYNMYNPFIDASASNYHFLLAVIFEMILIDIACLQQVVDDSYAVLYVSILRTHLQILINRISKLNTNPEALLQTNLDELKLCIIDHKDLIELYSKIASVVSVTIFVQFTITAIILSSTLINMLLFATDFASMVASGLYVLAIVMEIFPLCYNAQCLMDESNRLSDVIFHSRWVDQNERYRKMLVFFIQRSQITFEFTAGKLFPITLRSFLSIAKFSLSLYTLVKEMDLKVKFAE